MLIDFEISPEEMEKIISLVNSGKYSSVEQFIQRSIASLILREEKRSKGSEILEDNLEYNSYIFPQEDTKLQENIDVQKISELPNSINENNEKIETLEIPQKMDSFESRPLISTFVTRFFPIKIIIRVIANHMLTKNSKWFRLEDVEEDVYNSAEIYAEKLKIHEENSGLTRSEKLSTGLPLPETAKRGKRGRGVSRMQMKISSSRERFLYQFLGHSGKKYMERKDGIDHTQFDFEPGQCMRMGLIGYTWAEDTGEFVLSLTESGKKFASLSNPIIDENEMHSLSAKESKFILKEIIPRFELEELIIDSILEEFSRSEILETSVLDEILEKTKSAYIQKNPSVKAEFGLKLLADIKKIKKCPKCGSGLRFDTKEQAQICQRIEKHKIKNPNIQERVAIMGRLTEMKIVEWIIGTKGKSTYKII